MLKQRDTRYLPIAIAAAAATLLVLTLGGRAAPVPQQQPTLDNPAPKPPMGWNSWDAYGESVNEKDIRDTAKFMADHLKAHGWEYVVVDSGWYVTNHNGGVNAKDAQFSLDA